MKNLSAKLGATAIAALMTFGGISPTLALPFSASAPSATSGGDVLTVQMRHNRRDRRHHRRGGGFERRGESYYYHGHRGYRHSRPGYRQYNGYWFPSAAFVAGAIIGGAASSAASGGNAHVQWCSNQYRSYRVSDDTFQPYNGPRQRCASPYD